MSWKRSLLESAVWCANRCAPAERTVPERPRSIFVLRNNDLGDLLVVTPLFEALRSRFPDAEIVAGVGEWNVETLRGNPHVTGVMVVNAPWHNRITGTRDPRVAIRYLASSPDVRAVRARRFDVGIDVLGSPSGALLMMRAAIPWRLGVKGYAGGHTGVQQFVTYNPDEHVGRAALRFAEILGATSLPENRPQIFLSRSELDEAERLWREQGDERRRVVIAPGGGHPGRAWPADHFVELARELGRDPQARLVVVGGPSDVDTSGRIAAGGAVNLSGRLGLRQTMAVISRAHVVFSNSSVAMHAAAAFGVRAVVLLGPGYESACAHARQWGYGGLTLVLGRDRDRETIYDPEDVVHAAAPWLAHPACSHV